MDDSNHSTSEFILNHVFLPSKLPQEEDPKRHVKEVELLTVLTKGAEEFAAQLKSISHISSEPSAKAWTILIRMLHSLRLLHEGLSEPVLEHALANLEVNGVIPLYISCQNAGVIIRKSSQRLLTFESFELLPPAQIVVNTIGKIQTRFPANPRLAVENEPAVLSSLSNVLVYFSKNAMKDAMPRTKKGGTSHEETRDTASPRYITEAVSGILRALSPPNHAIPETQYIQKRLDDHVLFKSAKRPWRRNAVWLLARVALQTTLEEHKISGPHGYKAFVAFFMAFILKQSLSENFPPSDALSCMNAKLARRLWKMKELTDFQANFSTKYAGDTVIQVSKVLEQRWEQIQKESCKTPLWIPPTSQEIEAAKNLSLKNSQKHLSRMKLRQKSSVSVPWDQAAFEERLLSKPGGDFHSPSSLPTEISKKEPLMSLHHFECWVEKHLSSWANQGHNDATIHSIATIMNDYLSIARTEYSDSPEKKSLMYLVIMELWIVMDRIAIQWCPLIGDYFCEIQPELFEALLLPKFQQMERLNNVDVYLKGRYDNARKNGAISIFETQASKNQFSNRYYNQSPDLKDLKRRIDKWAKNERDRLVSELGCLNLRYEALTRQSKALECSYITKYNLFGHEYQAHSYSCKKCQLDYEARNLVVETFEEPLPESTVEANQILFELNCPSSFSVWRDVTYKIILLSEPESPPPSNNIYPLRYYAPLSTFFLSTGVSLLGLASTAKSVSQSHYSGPKNIPTTKENILYPHAGHWALLDTTSKLYLPLSWKTGSLRSSCTMILRGPYNYLQKYLAHPNNASNSVISSLSICPPNIAFENHLAFGQIRCGNRIQWFNLLRSLADFTLPLAEPDAYILILQSLWQAEAPLEDNPSREAHMDVLTNHFGLQVIRILNTRLHSLKDNQMEYTVLACLVVIAARVLSLSRDVVVENQALDFLLNARNLALRWLDSANMQSQTLKVDSAVIEHQIRVKYLAILARSTFDIDEHYLWTLLSDKEQALNYLFSGVAGASTGILEVPSHLAYQSKRDIYLSCRAMDCITNTLQRDSDILDATISKIWGDYKRGGTWIQLASPGHRFWRVTTPSDAQFISVTVHVDIVSGDLWIDGRAFGRLPSEYTRSPSYKVLFGTSPMFTNPTNMPGMTYQARWDRKNVQLYFGMDGQELVIRTRRGDQIEEFVSTSILKGDIPSELLNGNTHWYNAELGRLEIKPLSKPWDSDLDSDWQIKIPDSSGRSLFKKDQISLDPHSLLYYKIHELFRCLEPDRCGLMVLYHDKLLEISVPRHNLTFFLDEHFQIQCRSYPGFILDNNQDAGCLYGLQSKLVLRPTMGEHMYRILIIPKGTVCYASGPLDHPIVHVNPGNYSGYYTYHIDTNMKQVLGNKSLESDYVILYLHAITSFPLPDPLTGRNGTSEALCRLKSAHSISFWSLTDENMEQLRTIAKISPNREFYPSHLRVMETVTWNSFLPSTSQHPAFLQHVQHILDLWENLKCLHSDVNWLKSAAISNDDLRHLTDRANVRNFALYNDGLYRPNAYIDADLVHLSRDSLDTFDSRNRERGAHQLAHLSINPPKKLPACVNMKETVRQWVTVKAVQPWTLNDIQHWLHQPIQNTWRTLFEIHRSAPEWSPSRAFCLGLLLYTGVGQELLTSLIIVSQYPLFKSSSFACTIAVDVDLNRGCSFDRTVITKKLDSATVGFNDSEEASRPKAWFETNEAWEKRTRAAYEDSLASQISAAVQKSSEYWPRHVSSFALSRQRLVEIVKVEPAIKEILQNWAWNHYFLEYFQMLETALKQYHAAMPSASDSEPAKLFLLKPPSIFQVLTLSSLLSSRPTPGIVVGRCKWLRVTATGGKLPQSVWENVQLLLKGFEKLSHNPMEQAYFEDLHRSVVSLMHIAVNDQNHSNSLSLATLKHTFLSQSSFRKLYLDSIQSSLSARSFSENIVTAGGLWPCLEPIELLGKLSKQERSILGKEWKWMMVQYALHVIAYQRSRRLVVYELSGKKHELLQELQNQRIPKDSEPLDWLLIQIDGDFVARSRQIDIANAMMSPEKDENAVMQLNMGEGKSSVIMPMISAVLADGSKLVRLIVPKPLARQQMQLLKQRLCGLTGRQIFYLPFNRSLLLAGDIDDKIRKILVLLQQWIHRGGIWLATREQVLSFKLLGLDALFRSLCGSEELLDMQFWLKNNVRDILDECDDILHTRHQLIYTVGNQTNFDGAPYRWEITQEVLHLFRQKVENGADTTNFSIKKSASSMEFPPIRILSESHGRRLLAEIAKDIIETDSLTNISFRHFPRHLKKQALKLITDPLLFDTTAGELRDFCNNTGDTSTWPKILLLRGLIAYDLLLLAFKEKRWRVDYGLDLHRSRMAVPYRAKDSPSLRSEFGHSDLVVTLTCLSYYYHHLNHEMFLEALESLLSSDNPDLIYESWIKSCQPEIPLALRSIKGMNLESMRAAAPQLHPILKSNVSVIDFYVSHRVFPRDAKEFPSKICTSGWDLALKKQHPTTGFSGTNDNQYLLPLSIKQQDFDAQLSTNALVLSNLLLEENSTIIRHKDNLTGAQLLAKIHSLPSRCHPTVLLDAGAQVLDQSNLEFANSWLARSSLQAAIYFDEEDRLCVCSKDGSIEQLANSPYQSHLDKCLIYLDDAHTRGTDLRIPAGVQAIVTTGPKMTKDKLVQACMRMRKLGNGHSLIFFVSEEVARLISGVTGRKSLIETADILLWTMKEACAQLNANLPSWVEQGNGFACREVGWEKLRLGNRNPSSLEPLLCEAEARSLEDLYCPGRKNEAPEPKVENQLSSEIAERFKSLNSGGISHARAHEELEIELMNEKEVEREIERPPPATPASHSLHRDLVAYAQTGLVPRGSDVFLNLAYAFKNTLLNPPRDWDSIFADISITEDFYRTIQLSRYNKAGEMNSFLRPVQWILRSSLDTRIAIISPFEANELIPYIRKGSVASLHIYSPRTSRSMQSLDTLDYFTMPITPSTPVFIPPARIKHLLNLFSGALYLNDHASYQEVCEILGLYLGSLDEHETSTVDITGFVRDQALRKRLIGSAKGFKENPVSFFRVLYTLRHYGRSIAPTHIGHILRGRGLKETDF